MNLFDPLCITAIGALAGALARRFAPRAMPRYLSQAVALGAVGAWGGMLLAAWLVGSGVGAGAGAGWVVAGAKAWACALLGAVIVLDGYHLVRRRQVCWPAQGLHSGLHGGAASSQVALAPRHLAPASAQQIHRSGPTFGKSAYAARPPVMRFGAAPDVVRENERLPGPSPSPHAASAQQPRSPRPSKRASTFALERKLARKRRLQRVRSGSRARAQRGQSRPRRPTT